MIMGLIGVFIIAMSLSMDAFSLALAYGMVMNNKIEFLFLSCIVGLFHFFMPLIGYSIGNYINIHSNLIVFLILFFIGFDMFMQSFSDEEDVKKISISSFFLFGFAVSIDSFSVGFTLQSIYTSYVICLLLFAFCSFVFTFIGLFLGNKIGKSIGKGATILGGIVLIVLSFCYLFE